MGQCINPIHRGGVEGSGQGLCKAPCKIAVTPRHGRFYNSSGIMFRYQASGSGVGRGRWSRSSKGVKSQFSCISRKAKLALMGSWSLT